MGFGIFFPFDMTTICFLFLKWGVIWKKIFFFLSGFDGTSNVLAGKLYDIPVQGTHAHAFVNSFIDFHSLKNRVSIPKLL